MRSASDAGSTASCVHVKYITILLLELRCACAAVPGHRRGDISLHDSAEQDTAARQDTP